MDESITKEIEEEFEVKGLNGLLKVGFSMPLAARTSLYRLLCFFFFLLLLLAAIWQYA